VAIQQIQALLAEEAVVRGEGEGIEGSNIEFHRKMAKPPVSNEEAGKVEGFITVYRLYLRMRMRETIVEEQIQWVLSYV